MLDLEKIRARIARESEDFLLWRATDQTRQLAALYDALIDGLLDELATVSPERLAYKQGALAQLNALRRALEPNARHICLTV